MSSVAAQLYACTVQLGYKSDGYTVDQCDLRREYYRVSCQIGGTSRWKMHELIWSSAEYVIVACIVIILLAVTA